MGQSISPLSYAEILFFFQKVRVSKIFKNCFDQDTECVQVLEYIELELHSYFNKNRSFLIVKRIGQLETPYVILFVYSFKHGYATPSRF